MKLCAYQKTRPVTIKLFCSVRCEKQKATSCTEHILTSETDAKIYSVQIQGLFRRMESKLINCKKKNTLNTQPGQYNYTTCVRFNTFQHSPNT
jgi:hypothetical protein